MTKKNERGTIFYRLSTETRGVSNVQKKASLACVECGSRNYTITLGASARTTRLEMNKHCKYCKKHTKHRETK